MVLFRKFDTLIYIKAPSPHFGGARLVTPWRYADEAKSTTRSVTGGLIEVMRKRRRP